MDEFFDKVKEKAIKVKDEASKITKHMVNKTGDVVSRTKLSFAISETESKIKDIYTDIGKKVYDSYVENQEGDEAFLEHCQKIDALNCEICELQEKISELNDTKPCECGAYNKKEASYCSACGKKLDDNMEYNN